jgi:hypothetical protein
MAKKFAPSAITEATTNVHAGSLHIPDTFKLILNVSGRAREIQLKETQTYHK